MGEWHLGPVQDFECQPRPYLIWWAEKSWHRFEWVCTQSWMTWQQVQRCCRHPGESLESAPWEWKGDDRSKGLQEWEWPELALGWMQGKRSYSGEEVVLK